MGGPDLDILAAGHCSTTFPSAVSAAASLGQADRDLSCEVRVYMCIQHSSSALFAVCRVAFCELHRFFCSARIVILAVYFFKVLPCLPALHVGVCYSARASVCVRLSAFHVLMSNAGAWCVAHVLIRGHCACL
jgi:hypothetical protein